MRLTLYWRGRDVLDLELHVWKRRAAADAPDLPRIEAAGHLVDSERAEPTEPDTTTFGFGARPQP